MQNSKSTDGLLFQLFWQHPQNFNELEFIAQADVRDFASDEDRDRWIRDTFAQRNTSRPDGWVAMVCTSKSEHFLWPARWRDDEHRTRNPNATT